MNFVNPCFKSKASQIKLAKINLSTKRKKRVQISCTKFDLIFKNFVLWQNSHLATGSVQSPVSKLRGYLTRVKFLETDNVSCGLLSITLFQCPIVLLTNQKPEQLNDLTTFIGRVVLSKCAHKFCY